MQHKVYGFRLRPPSKGPVRPEHSGPAPTGSHPPALPGFQGLLLTSMRFKPFGTTISIIKRVSGVIEMSKHRAACIWFSFCLVIPAHPGLHRVLAGSTGASSQLVVAVEAPLWGPTGRRGANSRGNMVQRGWKGPGAR